MPTEVLDLWTLTRGRPQIDPNDLAEAVTVQAAEADLDYRTRMLIHDSVVALRNYWGAAKWQRWLETCPTSSQIEDILREEFDKVGFPSLRRRLMDKTEPDTIRRFFDHLGRNIRKDIRIDVAGSVALLLPGYLSRHTEDIDVVNEVPQVIRENYKLLEELQDLYGLHLGHVQSHYFPSGWQERTHFFDEYEGLMVYLVDLYDVFLSKLFSSRTKDMGDLQVLLPQLDKDKLTKRFHTTCADFLAAPRLKQIAHDNWHVLYGEDLPHEQDT